MMRGPEIAGTGARRGPVELALGRTVGGVVGRVGELFYRQGINRRNRRFDAGRGVVTLDRPVISVGNLSVGGTGKTPMVARVVKALQSAGKKPCIAMRGYGGASAAGGESDEASEYRRTLEGVPVVARADRVEGLIQLFATEEGEEVDCVVLDDGFQHRRLARDLDIVLIDASRDVFADRLLPAGWLREPVESLKRAQVVVVTHAEMVDDAATYDMVKRVKGINAGALIAVARHRWTGFNVNKGAEAWNEPQKWLEGKRVVAVCAIGNPEGFIAGVREGGAELVDELKLRDHDPFAPATVQRVIDMARRADARAIVTTEKDWSKLRHAMVEWPCVVGRPMLKIAADPSTSGWTVGFDVVEERVVGVVEGFTAG